MICPRCQDRDHLGCTSSSCTCGHVGSPVRPLTDDERQLVRNGTLTANVLPREAEEDRP